MTLQQAYDHARAHLLTQNARAMNGEESYVLLDAEGRRCALGCFIPPKSMNINELGGSAHDITTDSHWKKFFAVPGLRKEKKIKFFQRLMNIHDYYDSTDWRRKLDGLAEEFNLTINDEVPQ